MTGVVFLSDKAIQFLLLIDALKNTNRAHPKTSKELIQDMENAWRELFPDEPPAALSATTIGRHIKAMNQSGLYHIETCKNSKEGYYRAGFPFDAAEFSLIAQALYRSTSISAKETETLLAKFFNQTDNLGEEWLEIMLKQLRRTSPHRKTSRMTLPIIRVILQAIEKQQKLRFNYYERDDRDVDRMKKRTDEDSGKATFYTVSPYYLVWNRDECYLIAHYPPHDKENRHRLSHFKVSRIADKPRILDEPTLSIEETIEYPRYAAQGKENTGKKSTTRQGADQRKQALTQFSLDRYMRESLFMFRDDSPIIDLKLRVREEHIGALLQQFDLDRNALKAYPLQKRTERDGLWYSAVLSVQENEGLYMWLMMQANNVIVIEPKSVRQKLRLRLESALQTIRDYESGQE